MMYRTSYCIIVAVLLGFGFGCKKKTPEAAPVQQTAPVEAGSVSASKLPAAKEVMAALDKKDYDSVISGIMQARQSIANNAQMAEFNILADEVKIKLIDEAPSDPKASKALGALRLLTGGR